MKDFIEDLKWRGIADNIVPGIENFFKNKKNLLYTGIDPTAPSLHIGNLSVLFLLKRFQLKKYKSIIVLGGATSLVGDPSGKLDKRKKISIDKILYNQSCIKKQIIKILNVKNDNSLEILNNHDWFKNFNFLDFLNDIGSFININDMLSKEFVKNRLDKGITFMEFSYQLLQGYDFYYLSKNKNVNLQIGGSDQWGNMIIGSNIIKKKLKKDAFFITTPLILNQNGKKIGKTENENLWLDQKLTSSHDFYQFLLNYPDKESIKMIKIFSILNKENIIEIIKIHNFNPDKRIVQKFIAKELITLIHSKEDYEISRFTSEVLFKFKKMSTLEKFNDIDIIKIFKFIPKIKINKNDYLKIKNVIDLVYNYIGNLIFNSKKEVKRSINENSLIINKIKINDINQVSNFILLKDKYILVQKGKKNFYLIIII